MGDARRANCRGCRKNRREVGEMSWTGLCATCGATRFVANAVGISTKTGPEYEHWARRSLMAAHRALVAAREKQP